MLERALELLGWTAATLTLCVATVITLIYIFDLIGFGA